jgi:uncharacterized heparinase superfamily protein
VDIPLLLRTLRHLKLRQVAGQIRNRLPRSVPAEGGVLSIREQNYAWVRGITKYQAYLGEYRFRFLNVESGFDDAGGWWGSKNSYLWYYNLNYFEWLNQEECPKGTDWIRRWINDNPPSNENRVWEPYPVSLRIINWIRYFIEQGTVESAHRSLAYQAKWLMGRIETHLLGNHYLLNGVALLFAGIYFDGDEADHWLRKGWSIVRQELPIEVLSDGGHFERSTMYHCLILEDVLNLLNLAKTYDARAPAGLSILCEQVAGRMLSWLQVMSYQDETFPLFNDAVGGIASSKNELEAYARRLDISIPKLGKARGVTVLKDSGFARIETNDALLFAEIGGPGPSHQPGHAHAGTLGFEFAVKGERLLVDSGIKSYEVCEERFLQRSTAAHNTLVVAGANSSEVWSAFRVGRRAAGKYVPEDGDASKTSLSAEHDGYERLGLGGKHRRKWKFSNHCLSIDDSIVAKGSQCVELRFHFAPGIDLKSLEDGVWLAQRGDVRLSIEEEKGFSYEIEPYRYCPEFGVSLPAKCLVARIVAETVNAQHSLTW